MNCNPQKPQKISHIYFCLLYSQELVYYLSLTSKKVLPLHFLLASQVGKEEKNISYVLLALTFPLLTKNLFSCLRQNCTLSPTDPQRTILYFADGWKISVLIKLIRSIISRWVQSKRGKQPNNNQRLVYSSDIFTISK